MNNDLLKELNKNIVELKELVEMSNFDNRVAFNTKQAANYLSIKPYTLGQLARSGSIDFAKNGTSYIFRKKHLDAWLDKQERRAMNARNS